MINNLICETLSPENRIAKLYHYLNLKTPEEKSSLIKVFNKCISDEKQYAITISKK
jgi:hypothetical protein